MALAAWRPLASARRRPACARFTGRWTCKPVRGRFDRLTDTSILGLRTAPSKLGFAISARRQRFLSLEIAELGEHGLTPAIETYDLGKRYPQTNRMWRWLHQRTAATPEAVSHINLHVREGELFGLLGPNGAGKTTLVKLLCTLILPTTGSARVGGFDLTQSDHVRAQIGMSTGDERSFYWRLSGRQNLEFFAALCNLPKQQIAPRVSEVLAQLGLGAVGDASFQTYSSGMRQRLSIARAILHRPRILFLDEPTRSLDPNSTRQLHSLIQDELLARAGMTIFLTTHRLDEAEKLCHRVGIMHKGRLQAVGTLADLRQSLQARHRYHLTVSDLPPAQAELLTQQTPTLRQEAAADGLVQLTLTAAADHLLSDIISRIVMVGGHIQTVRHEEVSLEELFVTLTQEQTHE